MVNNWRNIIQNILFPPTCILCNGTGFMEMDLCQHCYDRLPVNSNCCYRCAIPFAESAPTARLCGRCLSHPPAFDESIAPYLYDHQLSHLITGLKFGHQHQNARLLGQLLANHAQTHAEIPQCLIPVPLHPLRLRTRGFNQAIEISRTVSQLLHLPSKPDLCKRIRNTEHQTHLAAKKRRSNLRHAFSTDRAIAVFSHVAIVDDVMTTGSTALELATSIKRAGVEKVDIWVCARAA